MASAVSLDAAPETVWRCLHDLPAWADWNPVIPEIEGTLETARRLQLRLELPDARPRQLEAEVMRVLPQQELSWLLRLKVPGLLDCEHRFLLQRPDDTPDAPACRLIQRLRVSGILVPFIWPRLRKQLGTALQDSNAGLKTAVQQP
nr:SRPBCC domain-containing protein [Methylonatrum kenyense]